MRMIGGFTLGGVLLGILAGVFAHFASYTAREGVFIVGGDEDLGRLLVRPPWSDLFGWGVAGLVIGLLVGVALRLLGFRLVRTGRRPRNDSPTD